MNEITVQVLGLTGSGKSTVIQLINEVLKAANFDVVTDQAFKYNETKDMQQLADRARSIAQHSKIVLTETNQARRPASDAKCLPGGESYGYPTERLAFTPLNNKMVLNEDYEEYKLVDADWVKAGKQMDAITQEVRRAEAAVNDARKEQVATSIADITGWGSTDYPKKTRTMDEALQAMIDQQVIDLNLQRPLDPEQSAAESIAAQIAACLDGAIVEQITTELDYDRAMKGI